MSVIKNMIFSDVIFERLEHIGAVSDEFKKFVNSNYDAMELEYINKGIINHEYINNDVINYCNWIDISYEELCDWAKLNKDAVNAGFLEINNEIENYEFEHHLLMSYRYNMEDKIYAGNCRTQSLYIAIKMLPLSKGFYELYDLDKLKLVMDTLTSLSIMSDELLILDTWEDYVKFNAEIIKEVLEGNI